MWPHLTLHHHAGPAGTEHRLWPLVRRGSHGRQGKGSGWYLKSAQDEANTLDPALPQQGHSN